MKSIFRRLLLLTLTFALATVLPGPSASAQTTGGGKSGCPVPGTCGPTTGSNHAKIGGRLRLARGLIRSQGPDSPVFGPDGAPADVTTEGAGASLRFRHLLDASERTRLRELGVEFEHADDGSVWHVGAIYLAHVPWSALDDLAALPNLIRAESTWTPRIVHPLEETARKVGASVVRRRPEHRLTGEGTVLGDLDSGFDIFHPHFFRADGEWVDWVDVEGDFDFDPGVDGVDLDGNGMIDSGETLQVLDGTVYTANGRENDDDLLQPAHDWLFVDANDDGKRNVGPDAGFAEATAAYGEPVFVVDDLDADSQLSPEEKLVRLKTSKFKKVVHEGTEYVRGENLIELGKPDRRARAGHGTGVASILIGGQPRFHDRVGLAPGADLVGYMSTRSRGSGSGKYGQHQEYIKDARDSGVDVLVHEWTDWYSTAQDGSTNLEQVMDTTRDQGLVHVNPLGNLNVSRKHKGVDVAPGESVEFTFQVDDGLQRGGQTYPYRAAWISLLWRTSQKPTWTLVSPEGDTVELQANSGSHSLGDDSIRTQFDETPRQTRHMLVTLSDRQDKLAPGTWTLKLSDVTEQDRFVARLTDFMSSWGIGIRWKKPTVDRGTIVFPSTADSAVGVAAFGGRHDMPSDGAGSKVGELRHYSSRGPRIDGARGVDIAAPDDPYAALGLSEGGAQDGIERSWFRRFGGTSGAGPHVAAALALLQQAHPSWGPEKLETRLFETADAGNLMPHSGSTPNTHWGHGKVDIFEAVTGEATPNSGEPPTADLDVRQRGDQVEFDASTSSDPDGDALEYRFDVNYDGEWDRTWAASATATISMNSLGGPGRYTARLQVRDKFGKRHGDADEFSVVDDPGDTGMADAGPDAGADAETADSGPPTDTGPEMDTDHSDATPSDTGSMPDQQSTDGADTVLVLSERDTGAGCSGCRTSGGPAGTIWWLGVIVAAWLGRRRWTET